MADARQMFIDGTWVHAADGATFDTFEPATGSVLASVPAAADVDRAVRSARRAFDDGTWGAAVAERDRGRLLFAMAEGVRRRREELADLEVLDWGKPLVDALAAGCTVALKPAEQTPLTALESEQIYVNLT